VTKELRGAVVAVTGGARGIGLAVATRLAAAGARPAIGDLDGDLAAERADRLGGLGLPLDVRDDGSFADFLGAVGEACGPVDVLVNNAGVATPGAFLSTSAAEHALQLAVNVGGVARGMRLVLPGMVARGSGAVVNLASAAGRIPAPGAAVYTASKHAVVGLTEAVRSELRGTGVRVHAILPPVVDTEMSAGLRLPLLPRVSPERVAEAVHRVLTRRRPPATVMVPRWLGVAALVDAASPQWLRDGVRRLTPVDGQVDPTARAPYQARVRRQLDR
jgi:NAD(P)-dependent dehydrogenase (short-subunit alcohol dehydrogenase family)